MDIAYHYLKVDIRDGRSCHFWFDDWLGRDRLIDITGAAGTIYLGVQRHAMVSDAVTTAGWNIRERNARRHQQPRNSIEQMRRLIDKAMRNRIYSLKYQPEHKLGGMLTRWFEITL
ncbi:hypothetical protein IGI04_025457 [Brassica rapa subsp. trilocularis]|uniref:Uncharacterized protein n=1 Tax=Brassica rapa subsp. trilocularis TaxID=1813537 RepID=A0ABQ7KVY3_BRACM|nr:hypothetical protein IGI04_025457 [Brassica rapa subsp. trilocularis]